MLWCGTFPAGSYGVKMIASYSAEDNKSMWEMRKLPQAQFKNQGIYVLLNML